MDEVERSQAQAKERAKALEARLACDPAIDPLDALRASLCGGNHGTAGKYGAEAAPPLTLSGRLVATVARVAADHKTAQASPPFDLLTATQRRDVAADYRAMAARIEAGR